MPSITLLYDRESDSNCVKIIRAMFKWNPNCRWLTRTDHLYDQDSPSLKKEIMLLDLHDFFIALGYDFNIELIMPNSTTSDVWFIGMILHGMSNQLTHFKLRYL